MDMLGRIKQYLHNTKPQHALHPLLTLVPDAMLAFSHALPIAALAGKLARVLSVRTYKFANDTNVTYMLAVEDLCIHLTIAQDDEGIYLAFARELPKVEWTQWFDKDALDFFLEPSSARTLKLQMNHTAPPEWSSLRYTKVIEAMEGQLVEGRVSLLDSASRAQTIHYTLLVNDLGDKAVEIEHFPEKNTTRLFATLYRPASDVTLVREPISSIPVTQASINSGQKEHAISQENEVIISDFPIAPIATNNAQKLAESVVLPMHSHQAIEPIMDAIAAALTQPSPVLPLSPPLSPLPSSPPQLSPAMQSIISLNGHSKTEVKPQNKPDFRRRSFDASMIDGSQISALPLPSFLLEPQSMNGTKPNTVAISTRENAPEQLRCDMVTAKTLLDEASRRAMSVRDVVREMLGLNVQMREEVMFEIPLTEDDYKELAMRYQMKASKREEIRARMLDELSQRISRPL